MPDGKTDHSRLLFFTIKHRKRRKYIRERGKSAGNDNGPESKGRNVVAAATKEASLPLLFLLREKEAFFATVLITKEYKKVDCCCVLKETF